jgi:LacI family transcriptional regulator
MSIVGYDDFTFGGVSPVPLTTYRQNFEEMSIAAVKMLLERLENPELPARLLQVSGTFVVRDSTAAVALNSSLSP